MDISRKELLKLGLAGGAGLFLPLGLYGCGDGGSGSTGTLLQSKVKLPEPFQTPLPVPPALKPARSDASSDYYEITQRTAKQEILPEMKTEVWGYNGIFPGPTIESQSGREVVIRQTNELPVPVSTHLHGGVTPQESDGYPTDLILPKGAKRSPTLRKHSKDPAWSFHEVHRDYTYPLKQRAMTLWYHDHRMDFTGAQVWKGLAGFHIIRDEEEDALPLPKGEKDVPLMICDRSFGEDGAFLYPALDPSLQREPGVEQSYMQGVMGDVILVNGAPWPFMEVSNTKYRFRILNASNARRYELALDPEPQDGPSFIQVGSDGGLLGSPLSHRTIPIAQAERFDVIIDFSKYKVGQKVTLKNRSGDGNNANVMQFRVSRKESEESNVPKRLSDMSEFEALRESDATVRREVRFSQGDKGMWQINGEFFDPHRIEAKPKLGDTEVWKIHTDARHPIHLHLVNFKVLTRGTNGPGPYDAGWKDTLDLGSEQAEILIKFTGYRGKYVFHCHNLEHEDMMMMANFEVV